MGSKKKSQQEVPEIIELEKLEPKSPCTFGGKAYGLAQLIRIIGHAGSLSPENNPASGGQGALFQKTAPCTPAKTSINFKQATKIPRGLAVSATKIPIEQWPEEVKNTFIKKVKELLDNGPIVCRSSAPGEDSAEKSFAGMFETVLNITNENEALAAANHCIASGNSDRVKKYAGTKSAVPMGLVVQQQVSAKAAGVCFTIDPTGKDRAVIIETVSGMGDRMVSGRVEPQRFRVYRSGTGDWEIPLSTHYNAPSCEEYKQKFFRGSRPPAGAPSNPQSDVPKRRGYFQNGVTPLNAPPRSGVFQKAPPGRRRQERGGDKLSKPATEDDFITIEEIKTIAARAKELEEKFGHALDLEWAIDDNQVIWWLQARPVTAAAAPLDYIIQPSCADADDGPVTVWSNWNVRETMPEPLFPFTWTFWRDMLLPVITEHLTGISRKSRLLPYIFPLDLVHGRIYFNLNAMLAAPLIGSLAHRLISTVDSRAGSTLKELKKKSVLRPRKYPGSKLYLFFSMLKASSISFLKMLRRLNPKKSMKILEDDSRAITQRKSLHLMSDRELIQELNLWARPECSRILYGLQMEIVAMAIYLTAKKAFKKHQEALDLLCTGIPANPTTRISLEIDALTEAAEPFRDLFLDSLTAGEILERLKKEEGGHDWLKRFNTFLENNGHRGPMEFDLGSTRWSDDPTMIIETIRSGLRYPQREKLTQRLARLAKKREHTLKKATAASPWWKRPFMRWLARKVELFMPLREAPKHYAVFVFRRIRQAALELGNRLEQRGVLPAADDVFFLETAELIDLVEGKKLNQIPDKLNERKNLYQQFKQETPPGFFRSDGVPVLEEIEFSTQPSDGILLGTAISGGSAVGPVCILSEPDPSVVQDGDILVMEYADPGWTPLFPRASGIIMEVGGLMCHAAVVARELGVPAVFGIANATTILQTGQYVRVDGTKGTVTMNPVNPGSET